MATFNAISVYKIADLVEYWTMIRRYHDLEFKQNKNLATLGRSYYGSKLQWMHHSLADIKFLFYPLFFLFFSHDTDFSFILNLPSCDIRYRLSRINRSDPIGQNLFCFHTMLIH